MRVDTLEAYNVPQDILAIWRQSVGENLLPVQEGAEGPAEEKYEELRARYVGAGIDVVVSSRDRREFDDAIAAGRFQIAVVVFEKLGALLVNRPQMLESVGLVVVDELQLITDENRGRALELLLTKLKLSRSKPRFVGLSAVLGKAQLLADWLGAKLLVDTQRPVELRKGVACKGSFTYREHNSGKQGTEPFMDTDGNIPQELVLGAAEDIVPRRAGPRVRRRPLIDRVLRKGLRRSREPARGSRRALPSTLAVPVGPRVRGREGLQEGPAAVRLDR